MGGLKSIRFIEALSMGVQKRSEFGNGFGKRNTNGIWVVAFYLHEPNGLNT